MGERLTLVSIPIRGAGDVLVPREHQHVAARAVGDTAERGDEVPGQFVIREDDVERLRETNQLATLGIFAEEHLGDGRISGESRLEHVPHRDERETVAVGTFRRDVSRLGHDAVRADRVDADFPRQAAPWLRHLELLPGEADHREEERVLEHRRGDRREPALHVRRVHVVLPLPELRIRQLADPVGLRIQFDPAERAASRAPQSIRRAACGVLIAWHLRPESEERLEVPQEREVDVDVVHSEDGVGSVLTDGQGFGSRERDRFANLQGSDSTENIWNRNRECAPDKT